MNDNKYGSKDNNHINKYMEKLGWSSTKQSTINKTLSPQLTITLYRKLGAYICITKSIFYIHSHNDDLQVHYKMLSIHQMKNGFCCCTMILIIFNYFLSSTFCLALWLRLEFVCLANEHCHFFSITNFTSHLIFFHISS